MQKKTGSMKKKLLIAALLLIVIGATAALIWYRVSPILNVYGKEFYVHTTVTEVVSEPRMENTSLGEVYLGMRFVASDRVRDKSGNMWIGGTIETIYDEKTGEAAASGKTAYILQSELTLYDPSDAEKEYVHIQGDIYEGSADHQWRRNEIRTEDTKARIFCMDQDNVLLIDDSGNLLWADRQDLYLCESAAGIWRVNREKADILKNLTEEATDGSFGYFGAKLTGAVRWTSYTDPTIIYLRGTFDRIYDSEDYRSDEIGYIAASDVTQQIDPSEGEVFRLIGSRYTAAEDICLANEQKAFYASGQDVHLLMTCGEMALLMTDYDQVVWAYTSDLYKNMVSRRKILDENEKIRRICVDTSDIYVDTTLSQTAGCGYFGTEVEGDEIWTDTEGKEYLTGTIRTVCTAEGEEKSKVSAEDLKAVVSFADTTVMKEASEKDYTCWLWGKYTEDEVSAQIAEDKDKKKTDGCTVAVILDTEKMALVQRKDDGAYLWVSPTDVYEKAVRYTARFITDLRSKADYSASTVKSLDYMTEILELTPIHGDEILTKKVNGVEAEYYFRTIRYNQKYYYQMRYATGGKAYTDYYSSEKKSVWNSDSYGSVNAVQKDILRLGFYIMSLEGKNGKGIRYGHGTTESPFEPETTKAETLSTEESEIESTTKETEETKPETLGDQNLNSTGVRDKKGSYWFDCSGFVAFVERSVFNRSITSINEDVKCTGSIRSFSFRRGYKISTKGKNMSNVLVTLYKEASINIDVGNDVLENLDKLKPGDLLFFYGASTDTITQNGKYDHVAIYLGVNEKSGVPEILQCTNKKNASGKKIDGICVAPLTGYTAAKVGTKNALGRKNTTGFVAAKRYVNTSSLLR